MNTLFSDMLMQLQTWVAQQQVHEQSLAACRTALINCAEEDREVGEIPLKGWKLEDIQLRFARHALIFEHHTLPYPFIETRIVLYIYDPASYHDNHERPIGDYRLITLLDGTIDDDYLVLDESPEESEDESQG